MDSTEIRELATSSPLSKEHIAREHIARNVRAWRPGCQVRFRRYTRKNNEISTRVEVIIDYAVERSLGSLDEVAAMDEDSLRKHLAAKFAGISK